ncbi:Saposin B-type domain-containing protein [Caenorhabditis elegans]|uniref:Saposin B-type domain-containing protein n=1 Tax=Caenorhabditis elegans TaxID=6239 RepID=O17387_CAEEL|nr:Saposin B-type domain-containing protein [Caenorhabditis elegans]CCD69029.1 Saposin B-type domain-containing protein [Caenorhabditis elegans]|eukprot:NP_509428.1 SaPosin-like Protein family [Caenorhabditis elegans]
MQSLQLLTFVLIALMVSVTFAEIIQKGKLAKHGMLKENKPNCLLTRSRLGCTCTTCKEIVNFTRMLILNHVPEEQEVMEKVCYRIFGDDKKKESFCEELIKEELPDIIKYVRNHLEPKQACAKFC